MFSVSADITTPKIFPSLQTYDQEISYRHFPVVNFANAILVHYCIMLVSFVALFELTLLIIHAVQIVLFQFLKILLQMLSSLFFIVFHHFLIAYHVLYFRSLFLLLKGVDIVKSWPGPS